MCVCVCVCVRVCVYVCVRRDLLGRASIDVQVPLFRDGNLPAFVGIYGI